MTCQGAGEKMQTWTKWPLKSYPVLPARDSISQSILQVTPETLKLIARSGSSETHLALLGEPRT